MIKWLTIMAETMGLQTQPKIADKYANYLDLMDYRLNIKVFMKKIIAAIVILPLLYGCEFWEVDKCLDRGGKWNYDDGVCEFEESAKKGSSSLHVDLA